MFSSDAGGDAEVVTNETSKGAHGYIQTERQLGASFVISGYGIKKGVVLDDIDNLDVAPTMATLLGVKFKDTDGRVLTEVLK